MTLDTASTPTKTGQQSSQNTPNVIKKSRNEVIKTIQEITDFDETTINRAIEACQDSEGRYSMDTVLNILMDEKYSNEQKTRDTKTQGDRLQRQYGSSPSNSDEKYFVKANNSTGDRNNDFTSSYGQTNNIEDDEEDDYEQISNYSSNQTLNKQQQLQQLDLYRDGDKPCGLKNLGNTCWFNSIIQALFHLPGFRQIIFSFKLNENEIEKLEENPRNILKFVFELRKLFALMLKSKRKIINPSLTLKCLKNCSKYNVELFNQEDVSEFTTILVNLIEDSFNILYNIRTKNQQPHSGETEDALVFKLDENLNLNKDQPSVLSSTQSNTSDIDSSLSKKSNLLSTDNNLNISKLNLKKNKMNPIVNLLNGDILVNRKNPDEDKINVLTEVFREVNIQMLNSRNLHAGLELEWGETSIDKNMTPTSPSNQAPDFNRSFYEQESWIKTLPRVLFICLNRYKFVKATQSSSKILEPFEFYQHLYLDRYMHTNKDLIKEKRKQLKLLRNDLKLLEDKLNSIKNFQFINDNQNQNQTQTSQNFPLDDVFKCVLKFVKTDYTSNDVFENIKVVSSGANQEQNLKIVENCLLNWINKTESKIDDLKADINKIKMQIETIFDEDNLKQFKYNLHSVCIHEGTSTSGHFWTYIWNPNKLKWYKYNDTEVCETTWEDVYSNSIGGSNSASTITTTSSQLNDLSNKPKNNERIPSAYFLIYIKADDSSLYQETNQLDLDLQELLKNDQEIFENQLKNFKLKKILNESIEVLKKSNQTISQAILNNSQAATNTEQNNQTCMEHARAFSESTLEALNSSFDKINLNILDHTAAEEALNYAIEHEINKYTQLKKDVIDKLPDTDLRINHILIYFNSNQLSHELKVLALIDLFRIDIFKENDLKLKILQILAQIKYNEYILASLNSTQATATNLATNSTSSPQQQQQQPQQTQPLFKIYEKYLNEYRDYRSIIAAFINAVTFMESHRYEEATPFFCVACEYNERITSYTINKMKGMDHEFLLANRRKCLKLWNKLTIKKFSFRNLRSGQDNQPNNLQQLNQQELTSLIETMMNKFLPCFYRLSASTQDDKDMIEEIRQDWLNVLDSNLPGLQIFHDFMTKLFEEPTTNHYHSLNVNKTNLAVRYKDMVQAVKKL